MAITVLNIGRISLRMVAKKVEKVWYFFSFSSFYGGVGPNPFPLSFCKLDQVGVVVQKRFGKTELFHLFLNYLPDNFYRTQVSLWSDLWVRVSLTK